MQIRGPTDVPWYNHHSAQRPLYSSNDRLPSLSLPQPQSSGNGSNTNIGSTPSAPRITSLASSSSSSSLPSGSSNAASAFGHGDAANGSYTPPSADHSSGLGASGHGLPAASPPPPPPHQAQYTTPPQQQSSQGYPYQQESYGQTNNMNAHAQPYMDMHHSHLSGGQQVAPQTVTSGGMSHYSQYGQPPLLQPGPGNYSPAQSTYTSYGYANGVASPQTATHPVSGAMVGSQVSAQHLPLPGKSSGFRACRDGVPLTDARSSF